MNLVSPNSMYAVNWREIGKKVSDLETASMNNTKVEDRSAFHHPFAELNGFQLQETRRGLVKGLCTPPIDRTKNAQGKVCGGATGTFLDVASAINGEAFVNPNSNIHAVTRDLAVCYHSAVQDGDQLSVTTVADPANDNEDTKLTVFGTIRNQKQERVATSIAKIAYINSQGKAVPKSEVLAAA